MWFWIEEKTAGLKGEHVDKEQKLLLSREKVAVTLLF
jgi:hypothetical protein